MCSLQTRMAHYNDHDNIDRNIFFSLKKFFLIRGCKLVKDQCRLDIKSTHSHRGQMNGKDNLHIVKMLAA